MATNIVGTLVALTGIAGVLTGFSLLLAPKWLTTLFGLTIADRSAALFARVIGIRNFTTGVLSLWASYALALAHRSDVTTLAFALGILWTLIHGYDAINFARIGSRIGMIAAGLVATIALASALLIGFGYY